MKQKKTLEKPLNENQQIRRIHRGYTLLELFILNKFFDFLNLRSWFDSTRGHHLEFL